MAGPMVHHCVDLSSRTYQQASIESEFPTGRTDPARELPEAEAVGLWGANLGEGNLFLGLFYSEKR